MIPLRIALATTASLCLCKSTQAQHTANAASITTVRHDTVHGDWVSYDLRVVTLRTATGDLQLPLDEVETIEIDRRSPLPTDKDDQRGHVWLRSGLELDVGIAAVGQARSIGLKFAMAKDPASIPFAHISALRFLPIQETDGGFGRALDRPQATRDRLYAWTRSRDRIIQFSTRVEAIDGDELLVANGDKTARLPINRVYGIVFGRDHGAAPQQLPRPTVSIEFAHPDQSPIIHGKLESWSPPTCRLRLREGCTLEFASAHVKRVTVQSATVAYLSQLQPTRVEQTPAFDQTRPWLRDRSPRGPGFVLGGKSFRRGLCLIPRTALSFDLGGGFQMFRATVGIDDRSSPQAHAVFRVVADGDVVYRSPPMTHGRKPEQLAIKVANVRQLTLETDFGNNFDLGDHCVFADARLLKN